MKPVLSPKDMAMAIGASESSVKRWIDSGAIPASKTAGGHRRIVIADAIRFIREKKATLVRPDVIGLSELVGAAITRDRPDAEELFDLLEAGRGREARGLVLARYLSGSSIAELCDGPIREAMARMGELWHGRDDGVYIEHRATDIVIQALNQIRSTLEVRGDGPVAVGGAPSGDPYLIPSMAAATVLAGEGWRTSNLGPETPIDSFQLAAEKQGAQLVWISSSQSSPSNQLVGNIETLARRLQKYGVRLVVGGRNAEKFTVDTNPTIYVGRTMAELVAFARGLSLSASSTKSA